MLTSTSEVFTPAELSMKSVLSRPPASAYSTRPRCVKPEIAAFADDLGAQFPAVDAQRIVGAVADLGVALVARLHVGADAAVPQQVDRHAQDGADDLVGCSAGALEPEQRARLGDSAMDFALRG